MSTRRRPATPGCVRRGEAPVDGWPVLDGQMPLLVLVCTSCQHVTEITDDGGRLPQQCPHCEGWAFTGELAVNPTAHAS